MGFTEKTELNFCILGVGYQ